MLVKLYDIHIDEGFNMNIVIGRMTPLAVWTNLTQKPGILEQKAGEPETDSTGSPTYNTNDMIICYTDEW